MQHFFNLFPESIRNILEILFYPFQWPAWALTGDGALLAFKVIFLFLPILLIAAGVFASVLSLITVIFRSERTSYVATVLITWWDSGKVILSFWGGMIRFLFLTLGYLGIALRIIIMGLFNTIKDIIFLPVSIVVGMAKGYSRPGVPWIAVFLTVFWIILEAVIFTHVMTPLVSDIMIGLTNIEISEVALQIGLFLFLSMLIGGSFACMYGLVEAIKSKKTIDIIKMTVIEVVVMFFEVVFFYREFVDSLAPWLAQKTNESVQLGLFSVLAIAVVAWLGVRFGVWFLFGKYGTPTLLSIISREGIEGSKQNSSGPSLLRPLSWVKDLIKEVRGDLDWFIKKGLVLLEAFLLPPIQVLAVTINFFMVLLINKNVFNLPLKSLSDLKDTKQMLQEIANNKR